VAGVGAGGLVDLDLGGDAFLEFLDMADDAHMAARLGVELAEGGDGMLSSGRSASRAGLRLRAVARRRMAAV
jgi:hypothetical protein